MSGERSDQVNAADVPTPSDTVDLPNAGLYIIVGVSGTVKVTSPDGSTYTTPPLIEGAWHKMAIKRLWDTGTTATNILIGR